MPIKKIRLLLLVALLMSLLLSACGGGNEAQTNKGNEGNTNAPNNTPNSTQKPADDEKKADDPPFANMELEVAVFEGAYGRAYWDQLAANFMNDYPGTKIKITANPKIHDIVRPQIVAGNPPDLIYTAGDTSLLDAMIKDRALLELTDLFDSSALDDSVKLREKVLPGILESAGMSPYGDGKIYVAPYNFGVMGIWYNKTLFDQHGIKPPTTWDEFFALNDTAKQHDRALFTYQGIYPGYLEEIIVPALYSAGGQDALDQYFGYDPAVWQSEAMKQVAGLFDRIASDENALMEGTVALNHTQAQTAFLQGEAMFIVNGNWFEAEMEDAPREEGFEFGFLGVPSFKAGDPVTVLTSVEHLYIPKQAKNPELAKEFLKYVYKEDNVKLNGELAKGVIAVQGAVEQVKDYISVSTYNTYKAVDEGMLAVSGSFEPMPEGSRYNVGDEIYNPLVSILNKELSDAEWVEKLHRIYSEIEKQLKSQ